MQRGHLAIGPLSREADQTLTYMTELRHCVVYSPLRQDSPLTPFARLLPLKTGIRSDTQIDTSTAVRSIVLNEYVRTPIDIC